MIYRSVQLKKRENIGRFIIDKYWHIKLGESAFDLLKLHEMELPITA
ncbi:MAG: hypothetical protein R3277_10825 [Brumimicrobium sp.]|nr:hypothetical protein [Brumimicrobium sp.]